MATISAIIAWVVAHWVQVLAVIGAIDLLLGVITKWTPCTWDDNLYAILHSWIAKIPPQAPKV